MQDGIFEFASDLQRPELRAQPMNFSNIDRRDRRRSFDCYVRDAACAINR